MKTHECAGKKFWVDERKSKRKKSKTEESKRTINKDLKRKKEKQSFIVREKEKRDGYDEKDKKDS